MKLIDELIMFKARRQELLNGSVKTTVNLKSAIRIEDKWILPESSHSWLELLRLDWAKEVHEVPKYYEEIIAPKELPENSDEISIGQQGVLPEVKRGEHMYALNEDLLSKLRISDEVTEWSLYIPPEGLPKSTLFANTGIQEISVESLRKFVGLKEVPVYFVKANSESEALTTRDIKLLLPEVYQVRKLIPRALVVIEVQTTLDDGSVSVVTGILVSHKDYQLMTLINDLPMKLQDYFNNRRKMLAAGALEYVPAVAVAPIEEPVARPTLRFAKRNSTKK